jgi:cofilin
MSSGVSVDDKVVAAFNDVKMGHKYKYVVFNLSSDATSVVVERTSNDQEWDKFTSSLPSNSCRYVVYDFTFAVSFCGN